MRAIVTVAALLATLVLGGCAAREADPEQAKRGRAEYELAMDAFKRGSYRESLAHVKTSLDHDAYNPDSAYLGAMIMLVFCADDETSPDCRYQEAEQFIRKATLADPEMRDAKNTLGVVLIHRGRPKEAIEVLEPLSQDMLYRSPEKSWGNLGWAYLEAGRTEDAIAALQRSVAAQPLFCVGHYRLGLAFEKKKELAAARQAFSKALRIEEGGCNRLQAALLGRARVSRALGQTADARKDLEQCRELAASTPTGRSCAAGLSGLQ
jgi:Tfp pilus assembly protein PilF